jgi:hypothetical protein
LRHGAGRHEAAASGDEHGLRPLHENAGDGIAELVEERPFNRAGARHDDVGGGEGLALLQIDRAGRVGRAPLSVADADETPVDGGELVSSRRQAGELEPSLRVGVGVPRDTHDVERDDLDARSFHRPAGVGGGDAAGDPSVSLRRAGRRRGRACGAIGRLRNGRQRHVDIPRLGPGIEMYRARVGDGGGRRIVDAPRRHRRVDDVVAGRQAVNAIAADVVCRRAACDGAGRGSGRNGVHRLDDVAAADGNAVGVEDDAFDRGAADERDRRLHGRGGLELDVPGLLNRQPVIARRQRFESVPAGRIRCRHPRPGQSLAREHHAGAANRPRLRSAAGEDTAGDGDRGGRGHLRRAGREGQQRRQHAAYQDAHAVDVTPVHSA